MRGGVLKADRRGSSISLFQLLADARVALTFSLSIFPLHFPTPSFLRILRSPLFHLSHISPRHPMYCMTLSNHPQWEIWHRQLSIPPPLPPHPPFTLYCLTSNTRRSHILQKCDSYGKCFEWLYKNNYILAAFMLMDHICVGELWVCVLHMPTSSCSRGFLNLCISCAALLRSVHKILLSLHNPKVVPRRSTNPFDV